MERVRNHIISLFEKTSLVAFDNPFKTIIFLLITLIPLFSYIPQIKMDTSNEGFLHKSDPVLKDIYSFREQFGRDELILISVESKESVFNIQFLKKLQSLHNELLDHVPMIDDITSLINARNTKGREGELVVDDLMAKIPEDNTSLALIAADARSNPLYKNMILSEDETVTTIVLKTEIFHHEATETDIMAGFDDDETVLTSNVDSGTEKEYLTDEENARIINEVRKITAKYNNENFKVHIAGTPVITERLKSAMKTNMQRFMRLVILFSALFLFIMFRSFSGVILPMLIVLLSVLATVALFAISGTPIKLPTQILPSFILVVAIGDSVHIMALLYQKMKDGFTKRDALKYSFNHSGLPVLMTSLTTAGGLYSFAMAELAPIAELGIFAASGVIIAFLLTLFLLPALISLAPIKVKIKAKESGKSKMDTFLLKTADFAMDRSKTIIIVLLIIIAFSMAGIIKLKFSHDPLKWLPANWPVRQATDFLDEKMKGVAITEVLLETAEEKGFYNPSVLKKIDSLSKELEQFSMNNVFVGRTLALTDIIKETNKALNENKNEFYCVPDNRELVAQELFLFENSGSDDMEDFVNSSFSKTRFTIKTNWLDAIEYNGFLKWLDKHFKEVLGSSLSVKVTGTIPMFVRTVDAAMKSTAKSYVFAALVITLMMIAFLGHLKTGLLSIVPNFAPIVFVMGFMGIFNFEVNMFTMLIGSIALGLVVDDTIHFLHSYRKYYLQTKDSRKAVEQTLLTSGRAMLTTSIVLSAGFSIYTVSIIKNISAFGLLTALTIIIAVAADFLVTPALINIFFIKDKGDK